MCVTNNSKVIIECPSCGSKNRVPVSMCNDLGAGKCGKCKSPLGEKEGWFQRVVGGNTGLSFVFIFVFLEGSFFVEFPRKYDYIETVLLVMVFPMMVYVQYLSYLHSSFLERKYKERSQGYFPPDWEGDFSIGRKIVNSNSFQKSPNDDDFDDDFWKNKYSSDPFENMSATGHY